MTHTRVLFEGAPNFRDLGGHKAAHGQRVRRGRLYRSDALAQLTDADLERLAGLEIGLLYDLRCADERNRHPNRWPAGTTPETICGSDADELQALRVFDWRDRIDDPNFVTDSARQWMLRAYAEMPRLFAGVLGSIIDRFGEPERPAALLHCTAGKDRTGFVSAILLLGLGVSHHDVFTDYMLSARRKRPEVLLRAMLGDELHQLPAATLAALHTMAAVRTDYLATALRAVEHDFGEVETYLQRACGISRKQLMRFRNNLLE